MELTKWPETEMEYWQAIEELGGFAWSMNRGLAHGRISDPTGGVDRDIAGAREISERLVSELAEKFGVIHPKDCPQVELEQERPPAPDGKVYYWDWYKRMKELSYQIAYEKIICSACPFSRGVEVMISLGGTIPCSVFHGQMYHLLRPYQCGMTDMGDWTAEELHQKILEKEGEVALLRFRIKEAGLKAMAEAAMQESVAN